jgi:hypothetical protein
LVSALGAMAGLVPAIHAGNASKTGPTWGGPQQSFAGTKLSPLPRSRTFDAPNHVDSRDKPGHDALKLVRRSPHNPDSDDQQLTRQEPQCAREIGAMVYVSGPPIPHGWRWWLGRGDGIRTQAAAAQDRVGRTSAGLWPGSRRPGRVHDYLKSGDFEANRPHARRASHPGRRLHLLSP